MNGPRLPSGFFLNTVPVPLRAGRVFKSRTSPFLNNGFLYVVVLLNFEYFFLFPSSSLLSLSSSASRLSALPLYPPPPATLLSSPSSSASYDPLYARPLRGGRSDRVSLFPGPSRESLGERG